MKKISLLIMGVFASVITGLALYDTPASAAFSDGKTCAVLSNTGTMNSVRSSPDTSDGTTLEIKSCGFGKGENDLAGAGLFVLPSTSQCVDLDNVDPMTSAKVACNSTTKDYAGLRLFAKPIVSSAYAYVDSKNGTATPTLSAVLLAINQGVYGATTPSPDTINWATEDCNKYASIDPVTKSKCEGIKACLTSNPGTTTTTCVSKWDTCMNGKTDAASASSCATTISTGSAGSADDVETCKVDGVGWIVCPAATFLAKITDGAYNFFEQLLVFRVSTDPFSTDPEINPTYTIWANIRNLANVAFIVAFFIVIFSQSTSIGLSNYGIKKMLPRIIVAAILVNLSYYLCVLAVDISNIIGASIDGIMRAPLQNLPLNNDGEWEEITAGILTGVVGGVALATLAIAATGTLFAFLAGSLLAIITAIVVLAARQAFLIILIILSPLAFVAYILPNTEGFFDKWRKAFISMLVLYPLVAVIFAGSQIAASVIRMTAPDGAAGVIIQVISLGVQAIPLFALPFLIKFSGGLLGRVAGIVNDRNKGFIDRARKRGDTIKDNSAIYRGRAIRQQAKKEFKNQQFTERLAGSKGGLRARYTRRAAGGLTQMIHDDIARDPLANRIPGVAGAQASREAQINALQKVAVAQESKAFNERVGSFRLAYEQRPMDVPAFADELRNALRTNNREESAALIAHLTNAGGAGGRQALEQVLSSTSVTDDRTKVAVNNAIYRDNYGSLLGKRGGIAKGGFNSAGVWEIKIEKLATEALATQDPASLRDNFAKIKQAEANRIISDPNLLSRIGDVDAENLIRARASGATVPPPPPP